MRIAYVALHLDSKVMDGGVGGKFQSQMRCWEMAGHRAQLFLLSPDHPPIDGIRVFTYGSFDKWPLAGLVFREVSRSMALSNLMGAVAVYKPDIVYLRYGLFAYPLMNIFRLAPVVVEINTNDIDEYRHRGWFFYWMNRLTRGWVLNSAKAVISPSHEIQQLPENRAIVPPLFVISNGIELGDLAPYPAPNNDTPVLVFAGSPGFGWHGVDKIIELAILCPDLQVEIVGYCIEDLKMKIPSNVRLHGFVPRARLGGILAGADVALGTLALHRKNMQEASALKVRESLLAGIPTIIAYEDTDLAGLDLPYLLRLPNTEENIRENAGRIRDFCYGMRGVRVERDKIAHRLDQRKKETARLEYFQQVLDKPR
ncbi:MAG: glycosyltransferase family 4 protein [Chloroflexi bacterium]|nr:glycosyltransferase family 4 protein [Chloroflexota bacterium]